MKLKRYHKGIYFPDWTMGALFEFSYNLHDKYLIYSKHAINKLFYLRKDKYKVTKFIKRLDLSSLRNIDYIFEFYANNQGEIKKVCYRFPMNELEFDLILVVSSTAKIVTIYTTVGQRIINEELYEKGEIINEG